MSLPIPVSASVIPTLKRKTARAAAERDMAPRIAVFVQFLLLLFAWYLLKFHTNPPK
jgi:hypothetical protein